MDHLWVSACHCTRMIEHPIQPLYKDSHGELRFQKNAIVRFLLDTSQFGLNKMACMDFSSKDWQQFFQLIGYSLSGYHELESFVDDAAYKRAAESYIETSDLAKEPSGE